MFLLRRRKNGSYILNKPEFNSRLTKILGFRPGDIRIYEAAFIHRSASFTLPNGEKINNERLEFLGDSVLDTILSGYLFDKYPDATEGFMTKIRSRIVNREVLNQLAVSMGINNILVSNISTYHTTKHLYGDALEALIGALFIDKGFRRTRKYFISKVLEKYLDLDDIINTENDFKSLVFEWIQKRKAILSFKYNEEYDPAQRKPLFTTVLYINRKEFGKGQGSSKKEAEQEAAARAWEKLKDMPE